MKKTLLVLVMAAICIAFFIIVSDQRPWIKERSQKADISMELQKDNQAISTHYPTDPKALIAFNDKIMSYLYSKKMGDELVEPYVDTLRKIYAKELLENNTKEEQMASILLEKEEYLRQNIKLLGSQIEEVSYFDGGTKATVSVIYYVNVKDFRRLYDLEKTSDGWKITSWQDTEIASSKLEE